MTRRGATPRSDTPYPRPTDVLLIAVWFGLLTGFLEVGLRWTIQKHLLHIWLFYGPHFAWMAPAAEALLFAILTGLFVLILRLRPSLASMRIAVFAPVFLSFLTLTLMVPGLHPLAAMLVAAGLAVHVSRFLTRRPDAFLRLVRRTAPLGVALVVLIAGAIFGWRALAERRAVARLPAPPPQAPNVLLVVLDTVRAQSLGLYGYAHPTSPALSRFARAGVRFDWAMATASWTSPSHYSLMTGRFPHELIDHWHGALDDTYPTLAEVLTAHGYVSGGFVANVEYAGRESGISRGFIHFEDYPVSLAELALSSALAQAVANNQTVRNVLGYHEILGRKKAPDVNRDFLSWLSRQEQRPFFAFLNYFDAHVVYLPPPPYDGMFGSTAARNNSQIWHFKRRAKLPKKTELSPPVIQAELNAYEGSIAYLDHHLGLLFDELRARGLLDNTLVIITSDHGEQFGEHDKFEHGNSLYRQALHVPLVISFPPRIPGGVTVAEPVSLRDLAATVIDLLGVDDDRGALPGRSLANTWRSADPAVEGPRRQDTLLSEFTDSPRDASVGKKHAGLAARAFGWVRERLGVGTREQRERLVRMKSLVADGHHYIKNGDGREELYDLRTDPEEERDLAGSPENQDQLVHLRTSLERVLALPQRPHEQLDSARAPSPKVSGAPPQPLRTP